MGPQVVPGSVPGKETVAKLATAAEEVEAVLIAGRTWDRRARSSCVRVLHLSSVLQQACRTPGKIANLVAHKKIGRKEGGGGSGLAGHTWRHRKQLCIHASDKENACKHIRGGFQATSALSSQKNGPSQYAICPKLLLRAVIQALDNPPTGATSAARDAEQRRGCEPQRQP